MLTMLTLILIRRHLHRFPRLHKCVRHFEEKAGNILKSLRFLKLFKK